MIRSLRHDSSIGDGGARFDDLMDEFKTKFDGASQWSITAFLAKGGEPKIRFQYCMNPNSSKQFFIFSEQVSDIQEVISLILNCNFMYCCRRVFHRVHLSHREYK